MGKLTPTVLANPAPLNLPYPLFQCLNRSAAKLRLELKR